MHVLFIVIAAHGAILGFGFGFAGFASLMSADEEEMERYKALGQAARTKGFLEQMRLQRQIKQEMSDPARIMKQWRERSKSRKCIYLGVMFIAIAAVFGYFLGIFK